MLFRFHKTSIAHEIFKKNSHNNTSRIIIIIIIHARENEPTMYADLIEVGVQVGLVIAHTTKTVNCDGHPPALTLCAMWAAALTD